AFIPANYFDEGISSHSRIVRMLPFRRNAFVTLHRAQATDLKAFEWLLKYASTETWYEKPSNAVLKRMKHAELAGNPADELPVSSARATEMQTPKVWMSAALTTPADDDVSECSAEHAAENIALSFPQTCQQCTDAKSEALEATDLVYCLVFSSLQAHDYIAPSGGSSNSVRPIYMLAKCGSREAAVAEIFHTTGLNGWSLVFSCVMRADESIEERGGKFRRVDNLWILADGDDDEESVKIFY
ncbi:uncharacterized protein M421DRAFT_32173, partial [Didymella exigua CBS 183.55]